MPKNSNRNPRPRHCKIKRVNPAFRSVSTPRWTKDLPVVGPVNPTTSLEWPREPSSASEWSAERLCERLQIVLAPATIQEAVDHIGITTFPGADLSNLGKIRRQLDEEGLPEIQITAGGFISEEDMPGIREMGVAEFFTPGTTIQELIAWAKKNIKSCY